MILAHYQKFSRLKDSADTANTALKLIYFPKMEILEGNCERSVANQKENMSTTSEDIEKKVSLKGCLLERD